MTAPRLRVGTVAIVGRPNVGKSTLLNELVGAHVSITSRKAQTTRHRILGIRSDERAQMVFVDTPGFQTRFSNALNRAMNRAVTATLAGVDAIVMVVEASGWDERDDPVLALVPPGVPGLPVTPRRSTTVFPRVSSPTVSTSTWHSLNSARDSSIRHAIAKGSWRARPANPTLR